MKIFGAHYSIWYQDEGCLREENIKIETVGMFETGLQHRCIWHELVQGVSCRLAPSVLKIQLESGFAQMEWNPCLNAVSVASVFPSALLIPPLPD